jgi:hypothetical protein
MPRKPPVVQALPSCHGALAAFKTPLSFVPVRKLQHIETSIFSLLAIRSFPRILTCGL